jgi:uncharacterized cupin superfamily protein
VLPAGFTYQWGQHEPVLKYALSYTPATPAGPGSVFTPMRAAALRGHGPLAAPLTLFAEPSGRFRAVLADCGPGRAPLVIPAGETLLTAVSGSPTVAEVGGDTLALAPGQSALVAASGPVTVNASGAARVLFCTVAS